MTGPSIAGAYALARQVYADAGVDTEAALARLDRVRLSLDCDPAAPNADELRAGADVALAQIPGATRFTVHAAWLEADRPVEPDAIRPEHFQRWVDWAKTRGIGLDFSPTRAPGEHGPAPGPSSPAPLRAWIAHCRASRAVSAHLGSSLRAPSFTELRVPAGSAGLLRAGLGERRRLVEALDEILASPLPREVQRDAVGCDDLALAYAARRGVTLCLDAGPLLPPEGVCDKVTAALPFADGVLLHVPGAGEAARAVAAELVRRDGLDGVAIAVDVPDPGLDGVAPWVLAVRDVRRALLRALLGGRESLPWPAVWAHYCESRGAPPEVGALDGARAHERRATPAAAASSEAERLFRSPEVEAQKERICDIGRRLWQRAYVDGNGGNVSVRVSDELVLCTPTLVSKGFMRPEDLCLVDLDGVQRAGAKRMTSEILMHLAIYRAQPLAKACVHAHPPHATGFAVSYVQPPSGLVPEMEVFCGEVPVAPYFTPGSPGVGESVARLCDRHVTVLMGNHGAVSWGLDVQDAYFKMEILESYCRTVLVATQLGGPTRFTPEQLRELLAIKRRLGIPDARDDGAPAPSSGR